MLGIPLNGDWFGLDTWTRWVLGSWSVARTRRALMPLESNFLCERCGWEWLGIVGWARILAEFSEQADFCWFLCHGQSCLIQSELGDALPKSILPFDESFYVGFCFSSHFPFPIHFPARWRRATFAWRMAGLEAMDPSESMPNSPTRGRTKRPLWWGLEAIAMARGLDADVGEKTQKIDGQWETSEEAGLRNKDVMNL